MIREIERKPIRYEEFWVLRAIDDDCNKKVVVGEQKCPTPNSYFESKEHDATLTEEVLDKVLKRLTNIDSCGWAMFSLCLIKEIVEDVKKGRQKDVKSRSK